LDSILKISNNILNYTTDAQKLSLFVKPIVSSAFSLSLSLSEKRSESKNGLLFLISAEFLADRSTIAVDDASEDPPTPKG